MIDYKQYQEIIKEMQELHPNDDYGLEALWKQLIDLLLINVNDTIELISDKCTPDEFAWTEAIFSDIIKESQSSELLFAMHKTLSKYKDEIEIRKYNIKECMIFADQELNDDCYSEFEELMKKEGLQIPDYSR